MGVVGLIWVLWGYSMSFGARRRRLHRQPVRLLRPREPTDEPTSLMARRVGRPGARRRRLPGDVRDHHGRPHQRRDRRPRQVRHLARLRRALGHRRLRPDRPHGVGRRLLAARTASTRHRTTAPTVGADRLRRRHGRAHQRRHRRPRARARRSASAAGFGKRADAPAQPAVRHARCRPAVVRLVRLQRRLGVRRRRHRGPRLAQHPRRDRRRHARLAASPRRSATATPPPWVPPRVSSPVWSRSPRPPRAVDTVRRDRDRRASPASCAPWRSASSTGSASTTRSTSSASTWSAASSAPSLHRLPRHRRRQRLATRTAPSTGCSTVVASRS